MDNGDKIYLCIQTLLLTYALGHIKLRAVNQAQEEYVHNSMLIDPMSSFYVNHVYQIPLQ